jgi:hypothetical protein
MSYDGIVKVYRHIAGTTGDGEITQWIDVNSITITGGRASTTEQPAATVATFTMYTQAGENPVPLDLNEQVRIMTFGTPDATYGSCWFIGRVSDTSVSIDRWSGGQGLVATNYTLTGDLALLNRREVGASGYPKQYDANRVKAVLSDSGLPTSQITSGVTYEIAAYNSGITTALELAQQAANSAKGVLYEKNFLTSGAWSTAIFYDTSTTRLNNTKYGFSNDEINALGLNLSASMTQCATVVTVTNYAGAGTTYTASVGVTNAYGFQLGTRETTLHNSTDANTIGQELLAARSVPQYRIGSISVNLASPAISSQTLGLLTPPEIGTRISFTLPDPLNNANLVPVDYDGFIEGFTVQLSRGQINVTLNLSNYGDLYPYTYWNNAALVTDTWNTAYAAATTWEGVI